MDYLYGLYRTNYIDFALDVDTIVVISLIFFTTYVSTTNLI